MSAFGGLILTNKGRNILAKAQSGKQLKITKVLIGDGKLGNTESILNLNALKNEVASFNIISIEIVQNNIAKVTFVFNNGKITEGFYWREIGVIVEEPDTKEEILYCYSNAEDNGDYIAAGGGADILEKYVSVDLIIENATNVSAVIDESLVFARRDEVEIHRYRLDITTAIPKGGQVTLPCYYKVGNNSLKVRYDSEVLIKATDNDNQGNYYEVGTEGSISNKIKITSDWDLEVGDVLVLEIQGVYSNENV